jgi:hypothetical protein
MKFGRRKSKRDDLLESVSDSLSAVGDSVGRNRLMKAAVIAGGMAVLTAGSSAISSLRRRLGAAS